LLFFSFLPKQIRKPANSGSLYFNYKKHFSIVLLALVDADYRFLGIEVGAPGSCSDGGILKQSNLGQRLVTGAWNIPKKTYLPSAQHLGKLPFVVVADEAFPLSNQQGKL
jgi:hypothetical protein